MICKHCYRERQASDMRWNAADEISDMCLTCYDMIGKGPGYNSVHSDAEIEVWFEGTKERREKYEAIPGNK